MEILQLLKNTLKWWWLAVLSTVVAAGASYYVSSQQPRIYKTTTTLLVGEITQKANPTGQDFILTEALAESYAQIALRQPVLQATVDSLGLKMSWGRLKSQVYVFAIPRTQLMAITVQDTSPERAVAIADELAYQLILLSPTSNENKDRVDRSQFIRDRLDTLEVRMHNAESRIHELEAELDKALSAREIQELETEINGLEAQLNEWQGNYTGLLDFLEGGDSPNQLTIIEPAQLPTSPIGPNVQLNVLLAAAAGFALAFGAALLLEYIDDTVKTKGDLDKTSGLTVLGGINRLTGETGDSKLISADGHSAFSPEIESYRLIRTNIQFASIDNQVKSFLVTSANPGEGKSTTAANLSVVMAQADYKTIIVDADLRRPTLHKVFQLPNLGGLTDLLFASDEDLDIEAYLKSTGVDNLSVITSGSLPPNASEILGSKRMSALLEKLEEIADVVIFDTPPVLPVTDATVLSRWVDGVILVVRGKATRREAARQAVDRLNQVNAKWLGAILNFTTANGERSRGYSYYYYTRSGSYGMASNNSSGSTNKRRWWQRIPLLNSDRV